jgi:hypothetical protein
MQWSQQGGKNIMKPIIKTITVDLPNHTGDPDPITRMKMSPRNARKLVEAYERRQHVESAGLSLPSNAWHYVAVNRAGFVVMSIVGGVNDEIGRIQMVLDPIKADTIIEAIRLELAESPPGIIARTSRWLRDARNRNASAVMRGHAGWHQPRPPLQ